MPNVGTIEILNRRLRDIINEPRRQSLLMKSPNGWEQAPSSMDVLEDTQYAIASFRKLEWPPDDGSRYLLTYGLLQALFLQQDAAIHLSEACGYKQQFSQSLKTIRDVRHSAIGHPTKRDRPAPTSFNHIIRMSLAKEGFSLITWTGPKQFSSRNVHLASILSDQENGIADLLTKLIDYLSREQAEHMCSYNGPTLNSILSPLLGVSEISNPECVSKTLVLSSDRVERIGNAVKAFIVELRRRDRDVTLELHEHCLESVNEFAASIRARGHKSPGRLTKGSKVNVPDEVVRSLRTILAIGNEIDQEYKQGAGSI